MPGHAKSKKKRIIWNNNDCSAEECKRPEDTSTWVKCDECAGWFHIVCVNLPSEELQKDKDWFCPECESLKKQEYEVVKDRLKMKVEELADAQEEFGGLTISRQMFKDKKKAGQFNFSQDFPPTLRDLCSRIKTKYLHLGDYKYEYQLMCKKMKSELLADYESRIQFIEFELDDIHEDFTKELDIEPELEPEITEPPTPSKIKTVRTEDVTALHANLLNEGVGQEEDNGRHQEVPSNCEYCDMKFSETGIYSCKRNHSICCNCRLVNSGCICPVCYSQHGDRRRLAIDHHANIALRCSNPQTGTVIKVSPPKGRPKKPKIGLVWSYQDQKKIVNEQPSHNSGINSKSQRMSVDEACYDAQPPSIDMSKILTENKLGNQLLTLIDTNVCADLRNENPVAAVKKEKRILPQKRKAPPSLSDQQFQQRISPVVDQGILVIDQQLKLRKEEIKRLMRLPETNSLVVQQIEERRDEINRLQKLKTQSQEPEVLDPLEALNQLESQLAAEEYMTSCNGTSATTIKTSTSHMSSYNSRPFSGLHVLPERTVLTTPLPMIEAKTEPESIEDQQSDEQSMNQPVLDTTTVCTLSDAWEMYTGSVVVDQIEKVESILPTSNDPEELGYPEEDLITEDEKQHQQPHEKKTVLDIQVQLQRSAYTQVGAKIEDVHWERGGKEHMSIGVLQFGLHSNYRGPGLEWRPFLGLCTPEGGGPVMYEFELGRAGHYFYIRAFTSFQSCHHHRWEVLLTNSDTHSFDSSIELEGEFDAAGAEPPKVLPASFDISDFRSYKIVIRRA